MVHGRTNGLHRPSDSQASKVNLVELAASKGVLICSAESLTAGLVTAEIAKTPGASKVLLGGMVVYQDQMKAQLLGVSKTLMESQTSVDPEVAAQLATAALAKFANAAGVSIDRVLAIATTGAAGPDAVGNQAPGTVFISIAHGDRVSVYAEAFQGDRSEVTRATLQRAILLLREHLEAI